MDTLTTKGYQVRHLRDATVVPCPCGTSRRIFTREDTPVANLHVTEITDSRRHYHKKATEYYYILEGSGKMELNDDVIDLAPGLAVHIAPDWEMNEIFPRSGMSAAKVAFRLE